MEWLDESRRPLVLTVTFSRADGFAAAAMRSHVTDSRCCATAGCQPALSPRTACCERGHVTAMQQNAAVQR